MEPLMTSLIGLDTMLEHVRIHILHLIDRCIAWLYAPHVSRQVIVGLLEEHKIITRKSAEEARLRARAQREIFTTRAATILSDKVPHLIR